jgi:hypothetical protein
MSWQFIDSYRTVTYFTAGANLTTADSGKALKVSSGAVVVNDTAAGPIVGYLDYIPQAVASGGRVPVVQAGLTYIIAGGTLSAGAKVNSTNAGLAQASSVGTRITAELIDAGTANNLVRALVTPNGLNVAS